MAQVCTRMLDAPARMHWMEFLQPESLEKLTMI